MIEKKSRETVELRQSGLKSSRRRFLNHISSGVVTMAALTATGQTDGLILQSEASAAADPAGERNSGSSGISDP